MIIAPKIQPFEVYPHDAPKLMTWLDATAWAKSICANSIGGGWRLPTRQELLLMYEQREEIGGFVTEYRSDNAFYYWSCTELPDGASLVYYVDFTDGACDWYDKDLHQLSSRLVRNVDAGEIFTTTEAEREVTAESSEDEVFEVVMSANEWNSGGMVLPENARRIIKSLRANFVISRRVGGGEE